MAEIEVSPDGRVLSGAAAERIAASADGATAARGRCLLCLSGDSRPSPVYELLASPPQALRIDWARLHLFWGDERCVAPPTTRTPTTERRAKRRSTPCRFHPRKCTASATRTRAAAPTAYERLLTRFFEPGVVKTTLV